jgi:uncharacterized protein YdcH (DUF465 family)
MSHTPHELRDEFPEDGDVLHSLKLGNAHFNKLADQYHDTNREIHRVESGVEAASDDRLEALKKARLHLVDEVAVLIRQAKETA